MLCKAGGKVSRHSLFLCRNAFSPSSVMITPGCTDDVVILLYLRFM